jgi:ABC-type branched-subunit amino acid transport system substrate-binding protein
MSAFEPLSVSRILARASMYVAAAAVAFAAGCQSSAPVRLAAPVPSAAVVAPPPGPVARHPLSSEEPGFVRLDNMSDNRVPVRVGIMLPYSNGSSATRALAQAMMKSAELALFDAHNPDILLLSADEGATPAASAAAVRSLLSQGAEIIVGPLFAQAADAVGPIARDRGVPVISFSTDRKVAGDGVYLLSFLPEAEVHRVVTYAASQGHARFAALIPDTAYGERVGHYFRQDVQQTGGQVTDVEKFEVSREASTAPALAAAKTGPDALLIAQGGPLLHSFVSSLADEQMKTGTIKLLGTGLWDDAATSRDSLLVGGWFAAPPPQVDADFVARYRGMFGSSPPQLASLAYDAVSLVALLSPGIPYRRFSEQALTDPNGFAGVDGIFRFRQDGTSERGLAVLTVDRDGGFRVISPAPKTFQNEGS